MACYFAYFLVVLFSAAVHCDSSGIDYTLQCGEALFTVSWRMNATKELVNKTEMWVSYADKNCNSTVPSLATTNTIGGITELNFTVRYDACGTVITETTDHIVINNTATLKVTDTLRDNGHMKRVYYYQYELSCLMTRAWNVSSNTSYSVASAISFTEQYNKSIENVEMKLSMDLYTDANFNTVQAGSKFMVESNQMIYVQIKEDTPNPIFKFVVKYCEAVTVNSPEITDRFFNDGCRLDGTFDRIGNDNNTFGFKIQAFDFISDQKTVNFKCMAYICPTDSTTSNCRQECASSNSRQRRDIAETNDRYRRDVNGEVGKATIFSKQIVFDNKLSCDRLVCPANSKCFDLEPARCICDEGFVLHRKNNTCLKERITQIANIHLDHEWNTNYANPSHSDFMKLATRYEDVLYKSFLAADTTDQIEGVRIVSASEGSVIFETQIIYAPLSTPKKALDAFISSVKSKSLVSTAVRRELRLMDDRVPQIVVIKDHVTELKNLVMIVIVVVLLVLILFATLVTMTIRRRRSKFSDAVEYGVEIDTTQIMMKT